MKVANAVIRVLWTMPGGTARTLTRRVLTDEDHYSAVYDAVLFISLDPEAYRKLKETT